MQRIAAFLSYALHPAVVLCWSVWLAGYLVRGGTVAAAMVALADMLWLAVGLVPGLGYLAYQVRRGSVSHPHLLLKEERRVVLPLLLGGLVVSLLLFRAFGTPALMQEALAIGVIEGVIATIITRFWKISLHAMAGMACAALFVPISWVATLGLSVIAVVTGLARLPIRHHTSAQVIAGWGYRFGMTLGLLALFTDAI